MYGPLSVFFDKQLNFVDEGSGVKQVDGEPGELETLASGKVVAEKDGFVYVYTSNESQQDVLFDNMSVYQSTGPILEETHYYPFGMTMAGISTVAPLKLANNYKYNGKELNDKEFSDGSSLDWYSYGFRDFDPQIGRFIEQDPLMDIYGTVSPYHYAANDPIANIDINGLANLPVLTVTAQAVHRMSAFSSITSKILGKASLSLAGKIANGASLFFHGAEIASTAINVWGVTEAVGQQVVSPLFEYNIDKKTGKITKVSDKGGNEKDYYNVGTMNDKGEFQTDQTITVDRPKEGRNINSFRFKETQNSTTSIFNIPGTDIEGYILEPSGPSTTTPNQDKRIPEGTYNIEDYSSDKYPNNFRIYNEYVAKSRKILIHVGNYPSNTEGCLMPGCTEGNDFVGSSAKKFKEIRIYIKKQNAVNIKLNIFNIIK